MGTQLGSPVDIVRGSASPSTSRTDAMEEFFEQLSEEFPDDADDIGAAYETLRKQKVCHLIRVAPHGMWAITI